MERWVSQSSWITFQEPKLGQCLEFYNMEYSLKNCDLRKKEPKKKGEL